MRLPSETSLRPIRPASGALISVNSSSSRAWRSCGLGAVEVGPGGQVVLPALVEELLGDVAGPAELLGALEVVFRELEPRLRGGDGGLVLIEGCLVGALVDGEERVARLHDAAVRELDLVEVARDPRPDVDLVDRLEAADEVVRFDDVFTIGFATVTGGGGGIAPGACAKLGDDTGRMTAGRMQGEAGGSHQYFSGWQPC